MPTDVSTLRLLLPVLQAAKIAGISKSELYRRIEAGLLPVKLIGGLTNGKKGKMRIQRETLAAMIDSLPNLAD